MRPRAGLDQSWELSVSDSSAWVRRSIRISSRRALNRKSAMVCACAQSQRRGHGSGRSLSGILRLLRATNSLAIYPIFSSGEQARGAVIYSLTRRMSKQHWWGECCKTRADNTRYYFDLVDTAVLNATRLPSNLVRLHSFSNTNRMSKPLSSSSLRPERASTRCRRSCRYVLPKLSHLLLP